MKNLSKKLLFSASIGGSNLEINGEFSDDSWKKLRFLVPLFLLFIWPLLLMAINDTWAVQKTVGYIDNWFYTGIFLNPDLIFANFPDAYYLARIPHLVLGILAHQIDSPLVAGYLIRAILGWLMAAGLYFLFFRISSSRIIATTAALVGVSNTIFLVSSGWDYVNGTSLVLIIWMFGFAVLAGQKRGKLPYCLITGAFAGLVLINYMLGILMFPTMGLMYIFIRGKSNLKRFFVEVAFLLCGVILAFIACGLISLAMGGEFMLLTSQFKTVSWIKEVDWSFPISKWLPEAYYLWYFLICLIVSTYLLLKFSEEKDKQSSLLCGTRLEKFSLHQLIGALFIINLGGFCFIQFSGMWVVLEREWSASFLFPSAILVFGALLTQTFRNSSTSSKLLVLLISLFVPPLLLSPQILSLIQFNPNSSSPIPSILLVSLVLISCILLLVSRKALTSRIGLIILIGFLGINGVNSARHWIRPVTDRSGVRSLSELQQLAIQRVGKFIRENGEVNFWYNYADPEIGRTARTICCGFLWGRSLAGEWLPELQRGPDFHRTEVDGVSHKFEDGQFYLVITKSRDEFKEAAANVKEQGIRLRPLETEILRNDGTRINLIFCIAEKIGGKEKTQQESPPPTETDQT